MGPQWFVMHAGRALPGRVRSIVLFGSAAAGDFVAGVSRYDLLMLIDELGMEELETLAPIVRDWARAGNPLPLLFTPAQFSASADAFAIEFAQMRESHQVLFGEDPLLDLTVDAVHVRIQLERELKGKSLALRDQYVLAAGDPLRITQLLCDSVSAFLTLFRMGLHLYQDQVPSRKMEALHALAVHIPFDLQAFMMVEELRESGHRLRASEIRDLFHRYWRAIECVSDAIDRLIHAPD